MSVLTLLWDGLDLRSYAGCDVFGPGWLGSWIGVYGCGLLPDVWSDCDFGSSLMFRILGV